MFDKVIEIRGFYICNAYVLVLMYVAFHMGYLGWGTVRFNAFVLLDWIGCIGLDWLV